MANGATYAGGGTGGNGLVVLSYGTGVTNQYTANQTINFYVNLSSYVNTTLYAILVPSNSFGTGSQVTSSRAVPGPPTGGSITLNAFTSTTGGSVTITGLGTNATKYAFYISTTTSIANAILASKILFGNSTTAELMEINERDFLTIFEGVQQVDIPKIELENGLTIVDALCSKSGFLSSNGEARRELKANAISVNKQKVNEEFVLTNKDLIQGKFILLGKGKKTNYILTISD